MSIVLPEQSFLTLASAIAETLQFRSEIMVATLREAAVSETLSRQGFDAQVAALRKNGEACEAAVQLFTGLSPIEAAARRALSSLKVPS